MAWDLWNSSHDQGTLEGIDCLQPGWQCDFYFGYGHDVIEEIALNEKSCIQVLRILITKADTEIDELEKDLVSLETELACTEHEDWPEMCCNALRDKIDCLDNSIRKFRNKCENDIEVRLSMHREPAEKIQDIVKPLLRKYFQEKEKQLPQVSVLDLKSDASADAIKPSESAELSQFASDFTVKDEFRETDTPTEECTSTNSSSKLQEEKTNYPKKIKHANTSTTDPSQECVRFAGGTSNEEIGLAMSDLDGTTRQWEAVEQELNSKDKEIIQNVSLKHEENGCNREVNGNMEAREQHFTALKALHPEGNQVYKKNDEQYTNAIVEYVSPDDFIRSAVVNARTKSPEFKISASRLVKSENCDPEKKPIELCTKSAQKEGIKDPKDSLPNKVDSSNSCSKMVVYRRDRPQIVTNTHFASTLQSHIGKRTIKVKLEVGEAEVESQKAGVPCDESHLNLGPKPQIQRAKRKFKSNLGRESTFPPTQSTLKESCNSICKRQKSKIDDDNASLKQLMVVKRSKKSNLPPIAQMRDSTVNLNFSDSHRHATNCGSVDNGPNAVAFGSLTSASHNRSVDDDPNALALVPFMPANDILGTMTVPQLKLIAKQYDITKLYKLRKQELIDLINAERARQIER